MDVVVVVDVREAAVTARFVHDDDSVHDYVTTTSTTVETLTDRHWA